MSFRTTSGGTFTGRILRKPHLEKSPRSPSSSHRCTAVPPTMIFDFFRDRATEGLEQIENIASKASQGKIGEAFEDTANYVSVTNEKFYDGLAKSRDQLISNLDSLFGGDMRLEETLEKLEELLMMADIGGTTTDEIMTDLRRTAKDDRLDPEDIKSVLRGRLVATLDGRGGGDLASVVEASVDVANKENVDTGKNTSRAIAFASPEERANGMPTVLFVIGANGMGKTTTIGKLAHRLRNESGQKVLLAACDTFRAAAVEQLEMWSERAEVDFTGPRSDKDKPAFVLGAAIDKAIEGKYDVLIVDTSGRLANNRPLNEELKKMRRTIENKIGRPPHETLLVVDALIGRNAVDQAQIWQEEVQVSGVVVTKLDGTARAGFVVAMCRDLGLPIKLIGVGEKIDDLRDFEPGSFVDALLGYDDDASQALQKRLDENLLRLKVSAPPAQEAGAGGNTDTAAVASSVPSKPSGKTTADGAKKKKKKKKKKRG
eukprot:CAMPEP_0185771348 /NCGR_PEP_ID=MMETSP1174-20130828/64243_1 /TAXON_ID=35687 /ORGANISM="Dictyocha speculum, Strain CCMP1381" /LENGTH=486 /DNA_ID=CAMNT_0028457201 /DNA_START=209 /DNA_END=1669 /DNA_ORIENTATION=-